MSLEAHATAAGAGHPPADTELPPGRRREPRRHHRGQGGERLRRLPPGRLVPRRRAASARALPRRLPVPVRPRAGALRRPPAPAGQLRRPGSEAVHELTNPALAPAGRAAAAAAVAADPARAARGRRRDRRGDAARALLRPGAPRARPRAAPRRRLPAHARHPRDRGRLDEAARSASSGCRTACASAPTGRDGYHRATTIRADRPVEPGARPGSLLFALDLPPGGAETIRLHYALHDAEREPPPVPADAPAPAARGARPDAWLAERTTVGDRRRAVQPRPAALPGRHPHAPLASRRHGLLRGRHPLVRDAVRTRLADLRHADAGLRPADGGRHAAGAGPAARPARRAVARRAARARCCTSCASGRSPASV